MPIEGVIECIDRLSSDYTKNDYVFVMAGRDHALQKRKYNFQSILNKLATLSHTNCVLVTVPYISNVDSINNYIYNFNQKIYTLIKNCLPNITYCDINSIISTVDINFTKMQIKYSGKIKLFGYLSTVVTKTNFRIVTSRNHIM